MEHALSFGYLFYKSYIIMLIYMSQRNAFSKIGFGLKKQIYGATKSFIQHQITTLIVRGYKLEIYSDNFSRF